MRNSKNKILAAVICGMVIGSVGTSVVGNFQSKNAIENTIAQNSAAKTDRSYSGTENRQQRDRKGDHHKGEASLEGTKSVNVADSNYEDGKYEGTADGFAKNLKVSVTINSGKISDIEIVSNNETPGFCEKAFETVPESIIQKQSTDVDTVSGATYSSVGIINAVNDALKKA